MTVSFEYKDKIIANADLAQMPSYEEIVKIWGKEYKVFDFRHELEIKQKQSGKKVVMEKNICELIDVDD
jgi:uncharacterized protein YlaN (UPF0358 family)